jgi:hypothetical protein
VLASAVAHAQLFFPEAAVFPRMNQWEKAIIADVTATLTAQTPWGEIKQVEHGKYWRSGGRIRQDDEHGQSIIVDRKESLTTIDRNANLILQRFDLARSGSPESWDMFFPKADYPTGNRAKLGETTLEDRKVVKMSHPMGTLGLLSDEAWISKELEMMLLYRYQTATTVFELRYHNIRLEEPPKSVFEIPKQMRLVVIKGRCDAIQYGISGTELLGRYDTTSGGGCK